MTTEPKLLWWPQSVVDEIMPEGKASPEEWIIERDGSLLLGDEDDPDAPAEPLADGEIVEFCTMLDYGQSRICLAENTYSVEAPMPDGAELCCILNGWQGETESGSVDTTEQMLRDAGGEAGEQYDIAFYTWSSTSKKRFDQSSRRFVDPGTEH